MATSKAHKPKKKAQQKGVIYLGHIPHWVLRGSNEGIFLSVWGGHGSGFIQEQKDRPVGKMLTLLLSLIARRMPSIVARTMNGVHIDGEGFGLPYDST